MFLILFDVLKNCINCRNSFIFFSLQEPSKHSKPSALRRTLQALRQRLTKRNRPKPPDWFLEKFSNTTNTDKIGKGCPAMEDAALSSEIRGTSVLCNRLSVDPTLQSHYRVSELVQLPNGN